MKLSAEQLHSSACSLLHGIATARTSRELLSHFSTTEDIILAHYASDSKFTPFHGVNAVRSYFDLLATHWNRSDPSCSCKVDVDSRTVTFMAGITWSWKGTEKSWREQIEGLMQYDDQGMVKRLEMKTVSGRQTCVMRATQSTASDY